MISKACIRPLRRFFKHDYHFIYLRSALWLPEEQQAKYLERVGVNDCRRACLAINNAISGCKPRSQQVLKYRYQQGLSINECTEKMAISSSTYYVAARPALLEFAECLQVIDPELFNYIMTKYD